MVHKSRMLFVRSHQTAYREERTLNGEIPTQYALRAKSFIFSSLRFAYMLDQHAEILEGGRLEGQRTSDQFQQQRVFMTK